MDLSILQKVNDLVSQGKSVAEVRQTLLKEGISAENISEALRETNTSDIDNSGGAPAAPLSTHHEKIIQPSPGFDPSAK
jgi:hypothetical protein